MIPKMLRRLSTLLLVGVSCGLAQVTVPDTPAGHTLQAWLDAFNSGDRTRIETYVKTIGQSQSVDGMISFRNQTGGFELLSIESSEQLHIRFRVKEKGGPTTALGNLLVKDGHPPTVASFGVRALPPGDRWRGSRSEGVLCGTRDSAADGRCA
jgi:retinol-binding protein 3